MPKWEYRIERISVEEETYEVSSGYCPSGDPWADDAVPAVWEPINDLGTLGWEMVSANWSSAEEGIAVFKREIEPAAMSKVGLPADEG